MSQEEKDLDNKKLLLVQQHGKYTFQIRPSKDNNWKMFSSKSRKKAAEFLFGEGGYSPRQLGIINSKPSEYYTSYDEVPDDLHLENEVRCMTKIKNDPILWK